MEPLDRTWMEGKAGRHSVPMKFDWWVALTLLALGLPSLGACLESSPPPGTAQNGAGPVSQGGSPSAAGSSPADPLEQRFSTQVHPFLERYCFGCHGPKKQKADLDLSRDLSVAAIAQNPRKWELVQARLKDEEMPPEDAARRPRAGERAAAVAWLRDLDDREARRNAGDPGIVLARRLSNAEFDCTIRDLTGVEIRPTREFPVDPANEAGFDNSGESLAMSEALLRKYLAAARLVADHLVLKPQGFVFAPHPAVTDTDRDKYCVERITAYYNRHQVDLADYFMAARGKPVAGLSTKYLAAIKALVQEAPPAGSPVAEFWTEWQTLPNDPASARKLADTVSRLRQAFPAKVDALQVRGVSRGSQPLMLWRNAQLAAQHRRAAGDVDAGVARFCSVFPDTFVVLERGPYYDKSSSPKGRLLSAGFHLMQGYYRDDGPLCELVLDDAARLEIDALWTELHFISQDPIRQYKDFIFFERAEPPRYMYEAAFDFARSEDKDAVSGPRIQQLREAYLAKARRNGASDAAAAAIETYFRSINAQIRQVEEARLAAEPGHLAALLEFAARAYRRPLSAAERDDLLQFYRRLRERDQLGHEDALRDTLAGVLMSPHFCYRFAGAGSPGLARSPLSDHELASRLSYFLWSSMPDAELLARAAAGDLHQPEVLKSQARRMLRDPKVRGLATEFAGNWLDVRRFEEHNAVDRERFPGFTNELRQSMFEEPIRYFMDIVQRNRSILDLLYGHDTFVNRELAKHYGMPDSPQGPAEWIRVEDARPYGRGGLLTMGVFLTKNAPGLRTSPVKRGYWVVRRLLGEVIPPPPATVPELPKDEANLGELSLPQVLARHREDKACAGCHRRFDSIGLVFEGFGPVGERRAKDLGGKPVQTSGRFPDGKDRDGVSGLRDYVRDQRQGDFTGNLCRKLLSYALGRGLQPSDRKTLEEMRSRLATDKEAFDSLVDVIVTCPQFLNKRGSP
jgi:hypothetical protein